MDPFRVCGTHNPRVKWKFRNLKNKSRPKIGNYRKKKRRGKRNCKRALLRKRDFFSEIAGLFKFFSFLKTIYRTWRCFRQTKKQFANPTIHILGKKLQQKLFYKHTNVEVLEMVIMMIYFSEM